VTVKAWLKSHQFDLEALTELFPAGNVRVVKVHLIARPGRRVGGPGMMDKRRQATMTTGTPGSVLA
jgi:hypothetical protein